MIKYIIFDMDGVIVDSEYDHAVVNVEVCDKLGIPITMEYAYSFVGTTLNRMMHIISDRFDNKVSADTLIEAATRGKEEHIRQYGYKEVPGVLSLIRTLKEEGYTLGIASSSVPEEIRKVLQAFGIEKYFDQVISGSMVKHPKPAPDIFNYALDLLGATPVESLVIEDSDAGLTAASKAGIDTIGFANPHSGNQTLKAATHTISDMNHCLDIIHQY